MYLQSKLLLIIFLGSFSLIYGQSKNNKVVLYKKARIYYNSIDDLQTLAKNGIAIDHGIRKKTTYVMSVFSNSEINTAKRLGFKVDIIIDNMQKHIAERTKNKAIINKKNGEPCEASIDYTTPTNFNLGSMGGFLTYSEILQELDDMRSAFPNLISSRSSISSFTTENSNTLQWIKISDNPDIDEAESEILYTALHHAREPASMQQLIFYMWYLLENYATNNEVKAIVDNTELYFVPVVNPDGYLHNESTNSNGGGFWRKNRRNHGNNIFGVDNNRNYDYIDGNGNSVWNTSGTSNNTSADNYAGTGPFSEIENQAIKWFVEQHDFKVALNNHTHGNLLLFPFGYASIETVDHNAFSNISKNMVTQNDFRDILSANLYPAAGDSDDFMYGETSTHNKIFSMTPEIGTSFWPLQNDIIPICKNMMYLNLTAAHQVNNYATLIDTQEQFLTTATGNLSYTIKRLGLTGTTNFTVSIVPVSSNISSVGNANQHNGLALLEDRSGSISYNLNGSIGIGEKVEYQLIIDNGVFTEVKNISKIFGNPQIEISDLGNNLNNWAGSTSWGTTNTDFVSASSSITDSPSGNYNNNQNSTIELNNSINLTTAGIAFVSFYAKWNIEAGFDYVQFEISTDNGSSWQPQCGKYTKNGVSDQGVLNQPVYDGIQNDWAYEQIDLSDYLGQSIKVRFQLVSDGGVNEDGFYFDDFKIEAIDESILGINNLEFFNAKLYPNPAKENITITLPNLIEASLKIYSMTGQLIKQLNISDLSTSINLKNFKSGVYILKLQSDTNKASYKIIKE